MRESISLVNRHCVRDTITRIKHTSGRTSRSVQRQDSLNVDIHSRDVEGLEHNLSHTLAIRLGVLGRLSQQDRVGLWGDSKLIVESVMPDLLHIIPVCNNSVLDRIFQSQHTSLRLGFVSDISIALLHTDHDTRLTGTSDKRWEHRTGSVVSGKSGFAHSGTIVNDKGGDVFVFGHGWFWIFGVQRFVESERGCGCSLQR
mmetsp:Transcript_813/g.1942  ORF Transcript_813/g.1942 Transcript_813/m.1942 type:complete len:200 (-) Transcript_813:54-653(-)